MAGGDGWGLGTGEMAHELRRPLGVARGLVDMLLAHGLGALTDPQRTALLRIHAKIDEALNDLEQHVLLDRAQTGAITAAIHPLDVAREVELAVGRVLVRIELASGGVTLDASAAAGPDGPIMALADKGLLARILDNLLDNAITCTEGAPQITVEAGIADRPFVRVADQGMGMDPRLREQIFLRGFRSDPSGTRTGSGLGLYLSRRAAEQMGAELWLEWTEPGRGSCFRLDLQRSI